MKGVISPALVAFAAVLLWQPRIAAHDGPPFPIVSNQVAGVFRVSVWTDPDATDDGSLGGQFWVMLESAVGGELPADVRARVFVRPRDREGPEHHARAAPIDGDPARQYAELLMDHEGPFAVRVVIESSAGQATLESQVEATYDLRPPPIMLAIYMVPFLLAGALWAKLMLRRRALARQRGAA